MHAKSDSDMTSLDPSSPRSPKRPVYYVQSPSRDSHDEDKSSSAPAFNSPMESPSHPSYARHSRASSSSRVSGTYGASASAAAAKGRTKRNDRGWLEGDIIEEESDYGEMYYRNEKKKMRRCQVLIGILGFVVLFSLFCLIIWGAGRPYKPYITVKSLTVHNFFIGQGSDMTGVPTKMLTTNCSVKMNVYNPATFFGIHVSSLPVNLMFSEIVVANGELKKYYQSRKSHRTVFVNLQGMKVPLYGAGASLSDNSGVPLTLAFDVRSRGYIVGKLVKSRHTRHVSCAVAIHSHSHGNTPIKFSKDSCKYE